MRQRTHRHEVGDSLLLTAAAAATANSRNDHSNNSNNGSESSSSSIASSAIETLEKTMAAATSKNKKQTANVQRRKAPAAQSVIKNGVSSSSSSVLMHLDVNRQPSMYSNKNKSKHSNNNYYYNSISNSNMVRATKKGQSLVDISRGAAAVLPAAKRKPAQDCSSTGGGGGGGGCGTGGTLAELPAPPMKQLQSSMQQRPSSSSSTLLDGDILLSMGGLCLDDAASVTNSTTGGVGHHHTHAAASTAAFKHNTLKKTSSPTQQETSQLCGLIDFALGEPAKRRQVGPRRATNKAVVVQNHGRTRNMQPLKSSSSAVASVVSSSVHGNAQPRRKAAVNVRQALCERHKQFNRVLHLNNMPVSSSGGVDDCRHDCTSRKSVLEGGGLIMSTILSIGASPAKIIRHVTRKRAERNETMSSLVAVTNNNHCSNNSSTTSPQPKLAWSRRRAVDFNQVFSPPIVQAVKRVDLKKTPVRLASVFEGHLHYQQSQLPQFQSLLLGGADLSFEQGTDAPCHAYDDSLDPLTSSATGSPRRKEVADNAAHENTDSIRPGGNDENLKQSWALQYTTENPEIPQTTATDSSHLETTVDDAMVLASTVKQSTQHVDVCINFSKSYHAFSLEPDADDQMDIDHVPPKLPTNPELTSIPETHHINSNGVLELESYNNAEAMESFILNDDDDVDSIDTNESIDTAESQSSGIEMQDSLITEIEVAKPRRSSVLSMVISSEKNITPQAVTMSNLQDNAQANVHDTGDEVMGEPLSEETSTTASDPMAAGIKLVAHLPNGKNLTSSLNDDNIDNTMSNVSERLDCDSNNHQKPADAPCGIRRSRRSREKPAFLGVFADDEKVARRPNSNNKKPAGTSKTKLDGHDDSVLLGMENILDSASPENDANAASSMRRRSLRIRQSQEARMGAVATVKRQPPNSNVRNKAKADDSSEMEGEEEEQVSVEVCQETNSSSASLSPNTNSLRLATIRGTNRERRRSGSKAAIELSRRLASARPRTETTVAKCQQEAMLHDGLPKPKSGAGRVMAAQQEESSMEPSGNEWSEKQIGQLRAAHGRVNPLSRCFWTDIAKRVDNKNALQCRKKWFSLVKTPKRVRAQASKMAKKKVEEVKSRAGYGDLFNSSPTRNTALPLSVDFGSGIKVNSIECRDGFFDSFVESGELSGCLHTSSPKAGYKTFVQGLKRDVRRAKNKKAPQTKASHNNAATRAPAQQKHQQQRVLKQSVQHGAVGLNGVLTPGGSFVMKKKSLGRLQQFDEDDSSDDDDDMMSDGWESEEDEE